MSNATDRECIVAVEAEGGISRIIAKQIHRILTKDRADVIFVGDELSPIEIKGIILSYHLFCKYDLVLSIKDIRDSSQLSSYEKECLDKAGFDLFQNKSYGKFTTLEAKDRVIPKGYFKRVIDKSPLGTRLFVSISYSEDDSSADKKFIEEYLMSGELGEVIWVNQGGINNV